MALGEAVLKVAREFTAARGEHFKGHPLANFIRRGWVDAATEVVSEKYRPRLQIEASPGKGRWNESPWLAFMEKSVTTSAQSGYYPVFLFEPGMQTFCLVLGQGTDSLEKTFGRKEALKVIANRAETLREAVSRWEASGFVVGPFNTLSRNESGPKNGADDPWSSSAAFGKRYSIDTPPSEDQLRADVTKMIRLYLDAVARLGREFVEQDQVVSELAESGELPATGLDGALKVSAHKRVEGRIRNQKLARQVKTTHGYRCRGCQIDLARAYPGLGTEFIEAHHLKPLSEAPPEGIQLTVNDFTVLCPTCHRVIHRLGCPPMAEFVKAISPTVRSFHSD